MQLNATSFSVIMPPAPFQISLMQRVKYNQPRVLLVSSQSTNTQNKLEIDFVHFFKKNLI